MNLELTEEEFRTLVDLVYAGNLMLNDMGGEELGPHAKLQQKIFSIANQNGFDSLISFDENLNMYVPTQSYENDEINEWIEEYENTLFFDELVLRFARRDALNYLGDENPNMSPAELEQLQLKYEDMYDEEIEYHGIARLKITPLEVQHVNT
ncbi:hypothetical protein AN640_02515 [Candidatus Epulonipiscium fishelsonii]|uniref:Uncharacterized protein n=1 Tax=Candidatus Epulonipiscium fishelsonii TaxID=77094 RepID=A0ACC8X8I3_9FIRM|nr:hypothetical protein AN640_02515 [Epulopiscium sp. SCG-D08WGA-EpuloA1]OON93375.1 MAG: hypothetical protein ATN32_01745 [Epulopiscium sp. AS2M-Bin002]